MHSQAAVNNLPDWPASRDRVSYVLQAKGLRNTAPYPIEPLQQLREALGLQRARTMAVADHGCAGGLLAVELATALLKADDDPTALALVLAGEKTFTPFAQMLPDVTITGEGTAAVLVGHGQRNRLLSHAAQVHGRADGTIAMTDEVITQSNGLYQDALADIVHRAVGNAGLDLCDIDILLPHNVNQVSWTVAADRLGLPKNRLFLDNIGRTGHCFAADPFINYRSAEDRGLLQPGDNILMTAVGLGQTMSATVLRH